MSRIDEAALTNKNVRAFLDMIAMSEGTSAIPNSENGYLVIVGSTPARPILMRSFDDHPRLRVKLTPKLYSTAAGRYQLLAKYFDAYKEKLGLTDFSPDSQDRIAIRQIMEQGALDNIMKGDVGVAIKKCSNIWASLPGAGYGQHEHDLKTLTAAFLNAGGTLA